MTTETLGIERTADEGGVRDQWRGAGFGFGERLVAGFTSVAGVGGRLGDVEFALLLRGVAREKVVGRLYVSGMWSFFAAAVWLFWISYSCKMDKDGCCRPLFN